MFLTGNRDFKYTFPMITSSVMFSFLAKGCTFLFFVFLPRTSMERCSGTSAHARWVINGIASLTLTAFHQNSYGSVSAKKNKQL